MRRIVLGMLGFWLGSVSVAAAQGLPEGTYASTKEGCTKLEAKKTTELGDDFDFYVLTSKGLTGYQQACDFVNVFARNATSWVATAFCDEQGYTYPDLFAIAQKDGGKLAVTRLTDLTQQGSPESSSDSEASDQSDQGGAAGDAGAAKTPSTDAGAGKTPSPDAGAAKTPSTDAGVGSEDQAADQVSAYLKCQNVKQ